MKMSAESALYMEHVSAKRDLEVATQPHSYLRQLPETDDERASRICDPFATLHLEKAFLFANYLQLGKTADGTPGGRAEGLDNSNELVAARW